MAVVFAGCVALLDMPTIAEESDDDEGKHGSAGGGTDTGVPPGELVHPIGFAAADAHGPSTFAQQDDCRSCHGDDLLGGDSQVGCDGCHQEGWRSNCTYCHGGESDQSGAPPSHVVAPSFGVHLAHVTGDGHPAYACSECHRTPSDVLSAGHVFDDTPAVVELDFAAGLSTSTTWDGDGCAQVYCHGDGRSSGSWSESLGAPTCNSCHAGPAGGNFGSMSGDHQLHINDGLACSECHSQTVSGSTIVGAALHVNGVADFTPTASITYQAGSCNGSCHGKNHNGLNW
jgi:predicted CxxxxCH...CXXCH cytochrome family protein